MSEPWTDVRSLGHLAWRAPVLDPQVAFDPIVGAELDGDRLRVSLASGEEAEARFSVPGEGILRVRMGAELGDPQGGLMLDGVRDEPAGLAVEGDSVVITGPGVEAWWSRSGSGFRFGRLERAEIGGLSGSVLTAGRFRSADGSTGWMETMRLGPEDAVYGGGESFQGPDLRGRVRRLVNADNHGTAGFDWSYINVPFFWSDAGWGAFFHTGAPVWADLGCGHSEAAAVAVPEGEIDAFFMLGDPRTVLRRYQSVTGLPGAFPGWAFGVWMSRCSLLSADEIDGLVEAFRADDCPLDVVHVDAWLEGNLIRELTCNWSIDRDRFPEGWVRRLNERGVEVSLWHNPYVLAGSPLAERLESSGALVVDADGAPARVTDRPPRLAVDFTDPDAVAWWKKRVTDTIAAEGNRAFKPDFGEELPFDALLADGRTGSSARNEYGLRYQRATHEAMVEALDSEEIALFCRSGTAGSQRYPCHWTGDTPATWNGLVATLRACLSLSLSGFGLVAHDVGGFWTPRSIEAMERAFENFDPSLFEADVDPELYARWTQWGAFSPIMRFHGTGRREPMAYPEPHRSSAIAACRLRGRLREYLVRSADIASAEGTPMMRPMVLAFPEDRAARDAELQYLLGPDVLVAPILSPGGGRRFYVPEGRWLPLAGAEVVHGPGWTDAVFDSDSFPAYVREGAQSPLGDR